MALYSGRIAAPGTPKATSTPSSSITPTTASITFILGIRSLLSRSPDLVLREVLDDPQERRVILATPALLLHRKQHLVHDGRHGQHHPVLPSRGESDAEVLVMQLRPEARVELVREELLPLDLHDLVACESARENLEDLLRRNPSFGAQNKRLAHSLDGEGYHNLVCGLGDLPRARGADVGYGVAHHLEEGSCALEVLLASPDHDRERPFYGTDVSARDRRVEHP